MLLRQMQTYVDMYCTDDIVEIALIYELTVSQCVGKAVFLDEADEMIEMFPAHFIPTKILISNLAAVNCAKRYICLVLVTINTVNFLSIRFCRSNKSSMIIKVSRRSTIQEF